jgi:hypothetical protein
MRRSYWLVTLLLVLGSGCKKDGTSVDLPDDCSGPLQTQSKSGYIDPVNGTRQWTFETDKGAGDCSATYYVYVRYADEDFRNKNPNDRPTVDDPLFSPPTPLGVDLTLQKTGGNPPGFTGGGWWDVVVTSVPTSARGNTTAFSITVTAQNGTQQPLETWAQVSYRKAP